MQHMIWRDKFDADIFHVGYRWPMKHNDNFHQRCALSIHIDDIEGMFGEKFHEAVKELSAGSMEFIELNGEFHGEEYRLTSAVLKKAGLIDE